MAAELDGRQVGNYRLISPLGEGPRGTLYVAEEVETKRRVALKQFGVNLDLYTHHPDTLENDFRENAEPMLFLLHPRLAELDRLCASSGTFFCARQLFDASHSLESRLAAQGRLTPTQAVSLARQLISALARGHHKSLPHLGLSPRNVFSPPRKGAVLADYGHALLSRVLLGNAFASTWRHFPFRAPEQRETDVGDLRSDVYSFGAVLYWALTGIIPALPEPGVQEWPVGVRRDRFAYLEIESPPGAKVSLAPISKLVPGIPRELDGVITACLAERPEQRFASAVDVAKTLGVEEQAEGQLPACIRCGRPLLGEAKVCSTCGAVQPAGQPLASAAPVGKEVLEAADRALNQGDAVEAERLYRRILRASPEDSRAALGLANALAIQRKLEHAETAYRRALQLAPGNVVACFNLAGIYLQWRRPQAARAQLAIVKEATKDPALLRRAQVQEGLALAMLGRYEQAAQAWNAVLEEEPENARLHYYLGTAYLALDLPELARKELEAAGDDPDALQLLANLQAGRLPVGRRTGVARDWLARLALSPVVLLAELGEFLDEDRWG